MLNFLERHILYPSYKEGTTKLPRFQPLSSRPINEISKVHLINDDKFHRARIYFEETSHVIDFCHVRFFPFFFFFLPFLSFFFPFIFL